MRRSSLQPRMPHLGIDVLAPLAPVEAALLSDEALVFLASLERRFGARRRQLIAARAERQARIDAGMEKLDFPAETADIRARDWRIAPVPSSLLDRRVEITGPVDRKMIINALNSGACAFMADFEDSSAPAWATMIDGQANLFDAVRRTIEFTDPASGKTYHLNEKTAVLIVRPRGLHMEEAHVLVDGTPISAAFFDFGLFFFHNAAELLQRGAGPYFYLPKLESRHEAALWREVFETAEHMRDLPRGSIRATVLIETLPAAFEMDEILYALRSYAAGLNCGRWDYIFSMLKTLGKRAEFILPDRAEVTMLAPALAAYSQLLIKTCHRRGAHAMGGMAAHIPVRGDELATMAAFDKVRADKEREARAGHDGTWVAHPGLIPIARAAFDAIMPGPNQLHRLREDVHVTAADLLQKPEGKITEAGLRGNIRVAIQYLAAWLSGQGCVPLYHLMEDAATAEICRTQVWQWRYHRVRLDQERILTDDLLQTLIAEEMAAIRRMGAHAALKEGALDIARDLFTTLCLAENIEPFLTTAAYHHLITV